MRTDSGKRGEMRSSALWGTGNRGGESRSNALWGKGGRGIVTALVAMLAISVPLASSAGKHGLQAKAITAKRTWVSPGLLRGAERHPARLLHVIIQSTKGTSAATQAFTKMDRLDGTADAERVNRRLGSIDAVAVTIRADKLRDLARNPNLVITADVPVHTSGYSSNQLWPYESGVAQNWAGPTAPTAGPNAPTIAIVDSGIQADRADFGGRVLASVRLSTLPDDSPGDGRGHGTFVAGIAAGGAAGYTGATPQANLVSVDVMDDHGVARTSDVIAGCGWILANKDKYNIRIANLSLHSATKSSFTRDPLDKAVEKLWFSGVVVVAAAGNYGSPTGPSGVLYAPGNDPFVITVGALDIGGTKSRNDDFNAPWSAYGRTPDGFMKPDLAAPGRYMIGPVPAGSTLTVEKADKVTAPGYIQLSGTSFAAPVISGAAAQILAQHPTFTPDQVKGALMVSAKPVDGAATGSVGVGELQMNKAMRVLAPPNPNKALNRFLVADPSGGSLPVFSGVSWLDYARNNVSWDSVSWDSVSWADASWSTVSWGDVSWDSASLADVSWLDVSWDDVSWLDAAYEDAAEGDGSKDPSELEMTPEQAAAVMADPEIAPDPSTLPADVTTSTTDGTASP